MFDPAAILHAHTHTTTDMESDGWRSCNVVERLRFLDIARLMMPPVTMTLPFKSSNQMSFFSYSYISQTLSSQLAFDSFYHDDGRVYMFQ